MLEIIKYGNTQYGNWVYGVLKYNGLEIKDIFSVNREPKIDEKNIKPNKIFVYRTKKDNLRFKIEI